MRGDHLRAGLSLSWPSHVHIQPNLLKSCHSDPKMDMRPQELATEGFTPRQICGTYPMSKTMDKLSVSKSKQKGQ